MKKTSEKVPLCPECYQKMKPVCGANKQILYHQCPKCGNKVLFSHAGH